MEKLIGWKCLVTLADFQPLGNLRDHVLGDSLSRAPHAHESISVNEVEATSFQYDDVVHSYETDQFFGPVLIAMNDD